ncbi:HD domain-containing protein [Marinibaculum pumilum]|uniref:HD domain-containing protein n=1 Tax=Marinibaculum pumilum TaxID=1766165 RepID=A0ABV7L787_9PROT
MSSTLEDVRETAAHDTVGEGHAGFTDMAKSTRADWEVIGAHFKQLAAGLPDRVLGELGKLAGDYGGMRIDRLQHSLQTATRAHRDGRDEEYVVCALLHDMGDLLGTYNHPDIAAAVLKPFVSEQNHWIVEKHGIFQGYYFFHHIGLDRNMREQFRGHPWFAATAEFCEKYDSPAFDPEAEIMPLSAFEPMVRRLFAAPRNSIYLDAMREKA